MPTTQQPKPGSTPFVTRVVETLADGHRHIHLSRRHRKRLPPLHLTEGGAATAVLTRHSPWLRFWAPRGLAWWIAVLFMLGSTCFAVGSLGANWPQALPTWLAGGGAIGLVFFVGSLFFTSAAWLQWLEATNGDVADIAAAEPPHRGATWRWFAWKPRNAGWLASLIQLVGTLLFNLNTGDAMNASLDWVAKDLLIWVPNMAGSVCFLAASSLALVEFSHGWWSVEPRQVAWWIVIINLLGSVTFQISALYGFSRPHRTPPGSGMPTCGL